jgi:excisionase family DNA binding protein
MKSIPHEVWDIKRLAWIIYSPPGIVIQMLTTSAAAERLGVTRRRVLARIKSGSLVATKVGRDWLIDPKDLTKVKPGKPGRPRKVVAVAPKRPRS